MNIVVCGLGHVGLVVTACLLGEGHSVIGMDVDGQIAARVGEGRVHMSEPEVAVLVRAGHAANRLTVSDDPSVLAAADIAIVCVGTRGLPDGTLDLSDVEDAARHLGSAIRLRSPDDRPMLVVFRSTMLPGSMTKNVIPAMTAAAGEPPGVRYEVGYNPEFTREGTAVSDYYAPARIIIGERLPGTAQQLVDLYAGIDAPIFKTSFAAAETVKFADNSFHALKIAFANEVGRFALQSGIDPGEVFDLFLADTKLNLSSYYLRPGGAFGGPCLPKDVKALSARMKSVGVTAPIVDHILESNNQHVAFLIEEISKRAPLHSRILLIGITFKAGTEDLRGSPLLVLAESLLQRGYEIEIYDPDLSFADAQSQLPANISAGVLEQLPDGGAWDLVIIGKTCPGIVLPLSGTNPTFHIDRL